MSQPHATGRNAVFTLPPSPLDLGATLTSAFKIMRARFGQLVVLALLPGVAAMLLISAAMIPMLIGISQIAQTGRFSPMIVVSGLLVLLASLLAALMQVKVQGMMTLAACDTIEQRRSTIGELWSRTRGLVGRVLALVVLVMCAMMLVYGLVAGLVVAAIIRAANRSQGLESAIAELIGMALLVLLVMLVATLVMGLSAAPAALFRPGSGRRGHLGDDLAETVLVADPGQCVAHSRLLLDRIVDGVCRFDGCEHGRPVVPGADHGYILGLDQSRGRPPGIGDDGAGADHRVGPATGSGAARAPVPDVLCSGHVR